MEHRSSDHLAAVSFYRRVLGLDGADDAGSFVFLRAGGVEIGAAYSMPDGGGWLPYFASHDAAAAVQRARGAGATLVRDATPVGEAGWSAWVADPEGTLTGIWQAGRHPGFGMQGEVGTVCRVELHTRRPAEMEAFLTGTFGLAPVEPGARGGTSLAAIGAPPIHLIAMDDRWGNAPAGWVIYFGVADVREATDTTTRSGGSVLYEPTSAALVDDFAVLADPLSNAFGVIAERGTQHP